MSDIKSKYQLIESKLSELQALMKKSVYNNTNTYSYHFRRWYAEVTYILSDVFGVDSIEVNRMKSAVELPAGKANEFRWIERRKRAMLRTAAELEAILSALQGNPNKQFSKQESKKNADNESYVDLERMTQLRKLKSDNFDFTKLIALCDELNINYSNGCYMSVVMLMRAIMDHVPPIFSCKKFTEVTNNYAGSKSFKESMSNLDKSLRKIADAYLHVQIRKSEVLPTKTQIYFSPDLDVLIGEIIRLYK